MWMFACYCFWTVVVPSTGRIWSWFHYLPLLGGLLLISYLALMSVWVRRTGKSTRTNATLTAMRNGLRGWRLWLRRESVSGAIERIERRVRDRREGVARYAPILFVALCSGLM